MKKINLKRKIELYRSKNWHQDIVNAYDEYIKGDSTKKKTIEDHYSGKEVIWEESLFSQYLKKIQ